MHISSEVREKSITKNFVNYKLSPFFVFAMIQRIFFILSLFAFALYDFFWRIVNPYSFHVLIKSAFLFFSAKAYCVHNKQNNTWLLVVMKFLFSCSTRYSFSVLTREISS